MDSNTLTHVAAILIGVLVTYFLVAGSQSQKTVETSRSTPEASSAASKTQKKKKKKKGKSGDGSDEPEAAEKPAVKSKTAAAPAPAPKAKPAAPKEEEKKDEEPAGKGAAANGKKKKKKNPKKPANGNTNGATNGESKKENESKAANSPAPAPAPVAKKEQPVLDEWQKTPQEEEWNDVVEPKKKKKSRPKPVKPEAAAASAEAPAPAPTNSDSISVDAKKIGIIIGPKGATMQAIQEATGCKLDINAPPKDDKAPAPKASILITGPDKESCANAKKAINELATKGYAGILQGDGFGEFSIEVHPRFLSEIVGPGGNTIKALQTTLDVKITIPSTDWKPNKVQVGKVPMAKVGIAGAKENAKACKAAIKHLMEFHHHEITHPGCIHEEVYVPQEFFHCVIGPRGSEIKHIRGNYKVDVYMPNADSNTENVLVVGKQTNVDKAISYIQLLMERDAEQREKKYSDEYYD